MSRLGIAISVVFLALTAASRAAVAPPGWLGVFPVEVDGKVKVDEVVKGSPADLAGIKVGDLLTRFEGRDITGLDHLIKMMGSTGIGQKVSFTLTRGRSDLKVTVVLGRDPEGPPAEEAGPAPRAELPEKPARQARPTRIREPRRISRTRQEVPTDRPVKVIQLKRNEEINEIQAASAKLNRPLLLEFSAPWAGPGRTLEKNMLASPVKPLLKQFIYVRVNVDRFGSLADRFKVDSIPHLVVLAPGGKKSLGSLVGVVDGKRIAAYLKRHLAGKSKAGSTRKAGPKAPARKKVERPSQVERQILQELRMIRKLLEKMLQERR